MDKNLIAHSPMEENLYINLQKCIHCGNSLKKRENTYDFDTKNSIDVVMAECAKCGQQEFYVFNFPQSFKKEKYINDPFKINYTNEPSYIIDMIGFFSLANEYLRILMEKLNGLNKKEILFLKKMIKECISEALKFFSEKGTPKNNFLFSKKSKLIYNAAPNEFSYQSLKKHYNNIIDFLDNIFSFKKVYSKLTGNVITDLFFLKYYISIYKNNTIIKKELANLILMMAYFEKNKTFQ